ncbi:MAG: FHIPEP family type III secretion protein, partial [Armatimonadetes bacterium]|nr:FHIPEP family type III secretion protein [Armatimonadota bacterium]
QTPEGVVCALPPEAAQSLVDELAEFVRLAGNSGHEPVVLTSPRSRPHVRSAIARNAPQVRVISYAEVAPEVRVEVVRQLGAARAELQVA